MRGVDFIGDHDVEFAAGQRLPDFLQPGLRHGDILLSGRIDDVNEGVLAVLFDHDVTVGFLRGGEFGVKLALHELADVSAQTASPGAKGQPESGGGFSLAVAGVHLHVAVTQTRIGHAQLLCRRMNRIADILMKNSCY